MAWNVGRGLVMLDLLIIELVAGIIRDEWLTPTDAEAAAATASALF